MPGLNHMSRGLTKNSVGVFEYVDYDKKCPEFSIPLQYQDTAQGPRNAIKRPLIARELCSGSRHKSLGAIPWPVPCYMCICETVHVYSIVVLAHGPAGGSMLPLGGPPGLPIYQSILEGPRLGQRRSIGCRNMGQGSPILPLHPGAMEGPPGL